MLAPSLRPPAIATPVLTPRTGTTMLSGDLRPPAVPADADAESDYEMIETSEPVENELEATEAPSAPVRAPSEEPTQAQKIQLALHGTRDQRNAILRDRNRGLHAFVLKNPGLTIDDVLAIAKNRQMGPEMYKQISERPEWFQRPQVALELARNPKVPGEIAIRALAHVAPDALRQLAKGAGAPPHVVQAARKKVVDR
jgi:hypothetical protein